MNNIKAIYEFLSQNQDIALATVGIDGKPKIRVFQLMKIDQESNSLFFATSPSKEIYAQLKEKPEVEVLCMANNVSVRIDGIVRFDVTYETSLDIYNNNPVLPRLYSNYKDLVYFRLPVDNLHFYDLNTNPPTNLFYNI